MDSRFIFNIEDFLIGWGFPENYVSLLNILAGIVLIIIIAIVSDFILKRVIINIITRIVKKSKTIFRKDPNTWVKITRGNKKLKPFEHPHEYSTEDMDKAKSIHIIIYVRLA